MIVAELINSCFELVVDRISLETHPISKRIKDTSALMCFLLYFVVTILCTRLILEHTILVKKKILNKHTTYKNIDKQENDIKKKS